MYKLLIKLVKCMQFDDTKATLKQRYIYTPFLGDVLLKPLSYFCVSTRVSTAYQYTKGPSRVGRTYVSIRSSYAEVLLFFSSPEPLGSQGELIGWP